MPIKIQLRGLKGLNSLSPSEYRKWRRDNAKYLGKYSTLDQEERLYNTQRFANKYGKDVARRLSYDQRVAIEKQDLEQYNNSIINKTVSDLSALKVASKSSETLESGSLSFDIMPIMSSASSFDSINFFFLIFL